MRIIIFLVLLTYSFNVNASNRIYKCTTPSTNTSDSYVNYWKLKTSLFGKDKLYRRKNGKWLEYCKEEKYCKNCNLEVSDDSFRCTYNHKIHSHSFFDLVSKKYKYYRDKKYKGPYGTQIIFVSNCIIE